MHKDVKDSIRYLKGVGPVRSKVLEKLGIETVEDLLYYFPQRYEDRTNFSNISDLKIGSYQVIKGEILTAGQRSSFRRRSLKIFQAVIEDDTASLACVWFNQPYLNSYLKAGRGVILYGKPDIYDGRLQMQNPEYEIIDAHEAEPLDYGRIVPIYSVSQGLSQRMLRRIVKKGIDEYLPSLVDILPFDIRQRNNLDNIASAILSLHFPQDAVRQEAGYRRIVFEECFLMQLMFGLKRMRKEKLTGIAHNPDEGLLREFEKKLPFELTLSQKTAIAQIKSDMIKPGPMHRLLQGDVGSGKTVVAFYACLIAVSSGFQAAFMAPTEILTEQHYQGLSQQVSGIRYHGRALNIGFLTSSLGKKDRAGIYNDLKNGKLDILIGTQALIQEGLDFKNLSLVVIDEQHKFGVYQRLDILTKGRNSDCLIMTATPIPRTLAMTVYADLDISTLKESPKGRLPVKTLLMDEAGRQEAYGLLRAKINSGRQAYIVYPIIDESQHLDLKAASNMYEDLRRNVFSNFRVGLIHGRMGQKERSAIMQEFKNGRIDILVSTVVIEVGIDVPNASVMMVEHAERFGLSQLHQLRGRIGRGEHESLCILVGEPVGDQAALRLKAIANESDGFRIAEEDLRIRGPGEFFGVRQHGITELRVNPLDNLEVINIAREEARRLLEKDPFLRVRQDQALAGVLGRRFPDYDKLMDAS